MQPPLESLAKLTQILVDSRLFDQAKPPLLPTLRTCPVGKVIESFTVCCRSEDSLSRVLDFVLDCYFELGQESAGLETFVRMVCLGCQISDRSCNLVLEGFCKSEDVGFAWCCYAAALRRGCGADSKNWPVIIRLLCLEGKLDRAGFMLGLGSFEAESYDLVIDCLSRRRKFDTAIGVLRRMCKANVRPRFSTYGFVLNGGCKFGDDRFVRSILKEMVVSSFLRTIPSLDYGWIVERLCEMGCSYAAEMFFLRAKGNDIELRNGVYDSMLEALVKDGRGEKAIELYVFMLQNEIKVNSCSCGLLISHICNEAPTVELNQVLEDAIGRGFFPNASDLSNYIAALCSRAYWKEAADLLHVALEKKILLNACCFDRLINYYCSNKLVDMVLLLHGRLKVLGGYLSLSSCHLLLKELFKDRKYEEAIQVFDYMKEKNVLNSSVFVVVIGELCRIKEMKKAMNLHDEMLKLGHKPDDESYKRLISWFSI